MIKEIIMQENFRKDVLEGLSNKPQKKLSSKYFYDATGDELFVKIMALPEYYLTRAEMDIFQDKTSELIAAMQLEKEEKYDIIELGAGDGTKTIHLLRELQLRKFSFEYYPVDISLNALEGLENMLLKELPELKVKPMHMEYFQSLSRLKQDGNKKIILFLGSNIGNMPDDEATEFIYQLGANMYPGDKLILGVDLTKPKELILPAYNDAQGITAAFNLNLLHRINRELDGNFDVKEFEHYPVYDENEGIAKSYLRSKRSQEVNVSGHTFFFTEGELIHTEVSRKYNDSIIKKILSKTDITWVEKVTDSNNLFADYILLRH
ncbi:L-histidine N(alpha)-methyltransferase [Lacibacter sp. MH-610]